MLFAIEPTLLLWIAFFILAVLLFWKVIHIALSAGEADLITRRLARAFFLFLFTAGLAFVVMISNIPIQ